MIKIKWIFWITAGLTAVLFIFSLGYRTISHERLQQQKVAQHAAIISESLWSFNPDIAKDYLKLACTVNHYKTMTVLFSSDQKFISIDSPRENSVDRFFESISLIRTVPLRSGIFHEGRVIGEMAVEWVDMSIYTYLRELFVLVLLLTVFGLALNILKNKRDLENQVQARTADLKKEILERSLAEESLHKSEERMRLFFERQITGLAITSPEKDWLQVNEPLCEMLGYTRDELLHLTWAELTHPDDLTQDEVLFNQMLAGERDGYTVDKRFLRKDRSVVYACLSVGCVRLPQGGVDYVLAVFLDITDRKRAEVELRNSEATILNKLKAIVEPEGDIGTLELTDIIDKKFLQSIMADFHKLTGMSGAVLDISGKVLIAVGWQDICTKFHRSHPYTLRNCHESDTTLTEGVPEGRFKAYHCKNNMWDMVTPLIVGGRHVGNVFIGQFFYEDEVPDRELFREQAHRYGFDEAEYMAALDRVPRFSRESANAGMQFYAKLTGLISSLSFSAIQQSRLLTEQKRSEKELRLTRDRLEFSLKRSQVGAWELDLVDHSSNRTPGHDQIFGYETPLADWSYEIFLEHVLPEDRSQVDQKFKNATATQTDWDFECRIRRPDGEVRWIWGVGGHTKNSEGEALRMSGVVQDITERKRTEDALRESEERYCKAQAVAHMGSWEYDIQTARFSASKEARRIYGLDLEEPDFSSDRVEKCILEKERVHQALGDLIEINKPYNLEYEIQSRDGTEPRMIASLAELKRDEHGAPQKIVGIIQDITERKQAEEKILQLLAKETQSRRTLLSVVEDQKKAEGKIRKLNEELEQRVIARTAQLEVANKELEAFSYSVSHDLRAPLRAIDGFSHALQEDLGDRLDEVCTDHLKRVRAAAQRMAQLIDDLLHLSRLSREPLNRRRVDLSALAQGIARELRAGEPVRHVELLVAENVQAEADPPLIAVVLENLLGNAWKFTSKTSRARIEFGRVIGSLPLGGVTPSAASEAAARNGSVFFVRDNGAGFDMQHATKLFGAFQRLHSTAEFPGTGIGLATVARIIHRHGGEVWAESEVNRGATFYFTLEPCAHPINNHQSPNAEGTE